MQFLKTLHLLLLFFGFLILFRGIACLVLRSVFKYFHQNVRFPANEQLALEIVLGAILSLALLHFCLLAGLSWSWALSLFLFLGIVSVARNPDAIPKFEMPSWNFLLWILVNISLGVSIFDGVRGEISTPWRNNYADLTFHLGMIRHLLYGSGYPEYHLFAGETLSYPFFINLWAAALWFFEGSWEGLSILFAMQWVCLTTLVYFLLRGDKNFLLPWLLLFAGGSFRFMSIPAGKLIEQGMPWTSILSSVWIPQRTALFGVLALIVAVKFSLRALEEKNVNASRVSLLLSALIFSVAWLVHAHFMLAGLSYVLCLYCAQFLLSERWRGYWYAFLALGALLGFSILLFENDYRASLPEGFLLVFSIVAYLFLLALCLFLWRKKKGERSQRAAYFLTFLLGLLISILFLPLLAGKAGTVSLMPGWLSGSAEKLTGLSRLEALSQFLTFDFGPTLLLLLLASCLSSSRRYWAPLLPLFLIFQIVLLSIWSFDQIKIFLALFTVALFLWSEEEKRGSRMLQWFSMVLIFPSVFFHWKIFLEAPTFVVYSKEQLKQVEKLQESLPRDAIIASSFHVHNGAPTLIGRRMYAGYDGTLFSHGIDYDSRREMMNSLESLARCPYLNPEDAEHCPTYLYWSKAEKKKWKRAIPPAGFWSNTEHPFLYRRVSP